MFVFLSSKRFVIQLILVFTLFAVGAAVLLGLPAAWLLERQTEAQLEALIEQSLQTTKALIDNRKIQIKDLAALLADRPTLTQLFEEEDLYSLSQYLQGFLGNADLDAILVCQNQRLVVAVGQVINTDVCALIDSTELLDDDGEAWLFSSSPLDASTAGDAWVTIGQGVNGFMGGISEETGMAYSLYTKTGWLISTTFEEGVVQPSITGLPDEGYRRTAIGKESTIQASVVISELGPYRLIGYLDINPYLARTRQFRNIFIITLAGVGLLGGGVAVMVARRISNPINQLAKSAASLREGDLSTPLRTPSGILEIHQLSNALEDARVSLKYSLHQLRQEKLWIENLMNSMVEGLITIDDELRITFASQSVEKIVSSDSTYLLGKNLDDVFLSTPGESSFSQQLPEVNQSRRIGALVGDREMLLSVSTSAVLPAESGSATRALMLRDVSDEERIHRLVGEFMANITHEFRTPLSALAASVELLRDELPTLTKEEMGDLLEALNIGIIDLQSLIDNLIEAASIEAGRFRVNPKAVKLLVILSDALSTVKRLMMKKGLKIKMSDPKPFCLVRADHRRVVQALVNLLSNAIKHSPEGGGLGLRILLLEKEVLVEVQDEGPGVHPAFQDRLFKRFTTNVSGQDLPVAGMGLGLSVVKAVIEAQGGRVGYRNPEEGGALFWLTLERLSEDDE